MEINPIADLREMLRDATQKQVAENLGVSQQYLCDLLQERRKPGDKILAALGLEKVVTYRRKRR